MTPDTLVQIDLSDENSWDQIDDSYLTADEKRVLREQFQEDTDAIIYLTEAELQDFKNILASEIPEVVSEELREFWQEQIAEWVSLTDFTSENNESLWVLESSLHEWLFGDNWIFKLHTISLSARNWIITWLGLSILEQISASGEDISTLISNTLDTLSVLQDACSETLPVMWSPTALHIAENGEANEIFMDPIKGQEFFSKILTWELWSTQEIQEALKNWNTDDKIVFKPEEVSLIIKENLRAVTDNGDTIQVWDQDVVLEDIPGLEDAPGEEASDEEKQSYIDKLKEKGWIFAVLAGILEFIQGARESITGNTESDDETTEAPDEEEEISPTITESARELFSSKLNEWNIAPFNAIDFQELFSEDWELSEMAQDIIATIVWINENTTLEVFEKEFNNLFIARDWKDTTKFQEFINASRGTLITETNIPQRNILSVLQEYQKYRLWGTGELYTKYFESPTSEESSQN